MKHFLIISALVATTVVSLAFYFAQHVAAESHVVRQHLFPIQAVDTMKYSRDRAREAQGNHSFDRIIKGQVAAVAATGATHISISTPYDEEFVPVLRRWVREAHAQGLSVWFRGNFSGWEGWFEYPRISRATHLAKTTTFIKAHADLFADGDIFTPCPECENGGPGDPRHTGDVSGFRTFIKDEHEAARAAFRILGIHVVNTYPSMNGDVARLIMDPATSDALGNVIVVDHYVPTTEQFGNDIKAMASSSQARLVLGEFGAPIPDLQGDLTQAEQAKFVDELLGTLYRQNATVEAVNYWTLTDSSTALVDDADGTEHRLAYDTLTRYYTASYVAGTVRDTLGDPVPGIPVTVDGPYPYETVTDSGGGYQVFLPFDATTLRIGGGEYTATTSTYGRAVVPIEMDATVKPLRPTLMYRLRESVFMLQAAVLPALARLYAW